MLKEVYMLIVSGNFDREPIEYEIYPTKEQILEAIKSLNGFTARVEKRYRLEE